MKKRLISVLAFALAVSAGAAFVLYQLISTRVKASASTKPPTVKVFVAAKDLELGALIQERDLKTVEYLSAPTGSLAKKEDIVGRGVATPIHQDSPFFEPSLAPKGAGAGFSATIPVGMRACAVHVNEVMGVAGFAVAGMHVDVLVSGAPAVPLAGALGGSSGTVTRTLLQDLLVMSAGQNYQKDSEGKPLLFQVVNLLVTPEQAELLYLATDQKIQLVLRNPADHAVVSTYGATTNELFASNGPARPAKPVSPVATRPAGTPRSSIALPAASQPKRDQEPLPAARVAPSKVTVEVYSGDKRSEAVFETAHAGGRQ